MRLIFLFTYFDLISFNQSNVIISRRFIFIREEYVTAANSQKSFFDSSLIHSHQS